LFAACADLAATVVCRVKPSVHAACQADGHRPVSVTAVYARLARVPAAAGRDLARHAARRLGPVTRAAGGAAPDPPPGYRAEAPDGDHLGNTQRRLKPPRAVAAGPLPGQTLVALDPAPGSAVDVIPGADGHARERPRLTHGSPPWPN
jgi:hypothetical protein